VILANKFFFLNGGSETVYFQERDLLKKAGVEVVDFAMQDDRNAPSPYAEFFVKNRNYRGDGGGLRASIGAGLSLVHSAEAVRQIGALIDHERPDILHCHNIYHQITPSIMRAAKRKGVRVVLTLHDSKVICPINTRLRDGKACSDCQTGAFGNVVRHRCADGSLSRSALLLAEAMVHLHLGSYEHVDKVIAPSRFMADAVSRWRFAPERVSVIYNGVDPTQFSVREENQGYLLYLGRLTPEKGLETLGRAQRGSSTRIKVAGVGPYEATLRRDFPDLELVGHQSGDALQSLMAGAAALVMPSECHENCPMAVLEAMVAGKPVIGSRMGGIPELVDDGTTGMLFDAGDVDGLQRCMTTLLADPGKVVSMGRAARRRIEQEFSLAQHGAALLALYRSLVASA
jgi:glycosyltransferase involved in cell wall biosynthesis